MKKVLAVLVSLMMICSVTAVMAEKMTMITNATFPPYEMRGENDEIIGIDAEIAAAIAAKLGYEFEIIDADFNAIIPAVISGKATFGMAGMTVTEERKEQVAFSNSYATGIQAVIVKEGSSITTADDLSAEGANYKIGVQQDTTGDIYCQDLQAEGKAELFQYKSAVEAVMALSTGKIDCVVVDNEPAKVYVQDFDGLVLLETAFAVEDYAACFSKNNTEMLEKFNAALAELTEDGTVADIIEKYIPTTITVAE